MRLFLVKLLTPSMVNGYVALALLLCGNWKLCASAVPVGIRTCRPTDAGALAAAQKHGSTEGTVVVVAWGLSWGTFPTVISRVP
jgi:hypothetical protein